MRVSQEDKQRTKELILVETLSSLKVYGPTAAPVDKIMKRLGLTSGALYSHFKSKEDLFTQVVVCELDRLIAFHTDQVQVHGGKAIARYLDIYLSDKHIEAIDRGCMFVALGADLSRLKDFARELVEEKMESLFSVLAEGFPSGSRSQRLAKAKFVFPSMVGALVCARSMKTKDAKLDILKSTKQQLLKLLKME